MSDLDNRTRLADLFDRARVNGVAYLLVIAALGHASRSDISDITGEDEGTLTKYLQRMESRGLCLRVRDGKADRWYLTPQAAATLQLHAIDEDLLPKISPCVSSSSDQDQIDSDQNLDSDQDQSEEEDTDRKFKAYLCQKYGFTGDKAALVVTDDSITADDIGAWMFQVAQMKRNNFRFKKSPEAYALHCLLKHDKADERSRHECQGTLDMYWTSFNASIESGD